jgi:hypothetical protein
MLRANLKFSFSNSCSTILEFRYVIILFFNPGKLIIASILISLHLVQIVTCSTVDVDGLQTFNSSILAFKLAFSSLRQEIESLQMLSSLDKF